jgi:O-antigen/teichoic acid export membrane protein
MISKVEIDRKLVFVNSASAVLTRMVTVSFLLWLYQYLLHRISSDEYSLYPLVMSVIVFMPLLTTALTSGLSRYIVEAYAKDDERGITQIVSTMFPILLGAAVALLAMGWTLAWHMHRILTIAPERLWDARLMLGLLVLSMAIRLPLAPFGTGLYVRQKFVFQNLLTLCTELFRISLLFVLLFGVSTRVLWIVTASVSADCCYVLAVTVLSCRLLPALRFRIGEIRWERARQLISFGGWSSVLELADSIRTSSDAIILNKLGTASDMVNFHIGSMFFKQIQVASYLARGPMQPPLTAMHALGATERLKNTYLRGGRYALWGSILFAFPMIIFRNEIMGLYAGREYLAAGTVMALLMAVFPVVYGNVMMSHLAHAKAELRPWAIRAIIIHSANLILTVYLVGNLKLGAVGSALGTFLVSVVGAPLLYWPLGLRLAGVNFRQFAGQTLGPGMVPGLAGAVLWIMAQHYMEPSSWFRLGICVAAGLVSYFAVLAFCLKPYDRDLVRQVLAKVRSAFLSFSRAA